jgi:hypothetical protein
MPSPIDLPDVIRRAIDPDGLGVTTTISHRFGSGTGAASDDARLVTIRRGDDRTVQVVRKTLRPLRDGPHAHNATQQDHWAFWRRELTAYTSGVLPSGPGLRAPRLYGIVDDVLYLEYVGEDLPDAHEAARQLGRWHSNDRTDPHLPRLARDQLAQRLAVTTLDWSDIDVDPRIPAIWSQRDSSIAVLTDLPWSIAHGDFNMGNLRAGSNNVIAIDWATLGVSPVGFDLAHLALSTLDDSLVSPYLDGLDERFSARDVETGYRLALGLVGTSRIHWTATRQEQLPENEADFVADQYSRAL